MAEVGEDAGSEPTRNLDTGHPVPQTMPPPDKVDVDEEEADKAEVDLLNDGSEVMTQLPVVERQQPSEDDVDVPVNPEVGNATALTVSEQHEEVSTSEATASEEDSTNTKVHEVTTQPPCVEEESGSGELEGSNTALPMSDRDENAATDALAAPGDVLLNFDIPSNSNGEEMLASTQVNGSSSSDFDLLGFGTASETPADNGTKSDLNGGTSNEETDTTETAKVDADFGSNSSAEVVLKKNGTNESDGGESVEQSREEIGEGQDSQKSEHVEIDGISFSEKPVLSPDASDQLDTRHQTDDGNMGVNSNNEPVEGKLVQPSVVEEIDESGHATTTLAPPETGDDSIPQAEEELQPSDGVVASGPGAEPKTESLTEEEEEWLSMGLNLGDALRQIVALSEEKEAVLAISQETNTGKMQAEALLVEVQSRLEAEMSRRAESDQKCRSLLDKMASFEAAMAKYDSLEDQLEKSNTDLVQVVTEKSKLEQEIERLREFRDTSEQKEIVLSNRLNEAKKKEANKSKSAGMLEAENEHLREELKKTKDELETTAKAKARLESNMEKLKTKAVERVKQAESALTEERALNEERKKKMKTFVETKAEELREAKESVNDMSKELDETRASLRSSRDREDVCQKEADAAKLKYRELQRDIERMKRSSEQLRTYQANFEQELEKSANETEEHKKKRISAKHEIMQVCATLTSS